MIGQQLSDLTGLFELTDDFAVFILTNHYSFAAFHFDGLPAAGVLPGFTNTLAVYSENDFAFAFAIAGATEGTGLARVDLFGFGRRAARYVAAIENGYVDRLIEVVFNRKPRVGLRG